MSISFDIELLLVIIKDNPIIWKSCLTFPNFGRWTLTDGGKQKADDLFNKVEIDDDGAIQHKYRARLHRIDGPAYESSYVKGWYVNGKPHRIDGPAVESINGNYWFVNGKQHRVDNPAVEMFDGTKEWWVDGQRYRENGPTIEYSNGKKEWHNLDGKIHREDGPAIINPDGIGAWYFNGVFQRPDWGSVEHRRNIEQ